MLFRSYFAALVFSVFLCNPVFAIDQIGSCRLLFAKNPAQVGKEMISQLQNWGIIPFNRISPSLDALFMMIDNDMPQFQRWVDAKSTSYDARMGFPFYNEYVHALILERTEMALYLVKSHLFESYEAGTIHDLLDLALYFNNQTLIEELARPRNIRFLQYRLDSSLGNMARFGSINGVKVLLDAGADVNKLNPLGTSPLMLSVVHRQNEIIDLFLEQPGLQIDLQGNSFYTALDLANYYKYDEIIEKIQQLRDLEK